MQVRQGEEAADAVGSAGVAVLVPVGAGRREDECKFLAARPGDIAGVQRQAGTANNQHTATGELVTAVNNDAPPTAAGNHTATIDL